MARYLLILASRFFLVLAPWALIAAGVLYFRGDL